MTYSKPLPVLAIIGRPNVGKSTLFNQLTKTHDAIVADFPGLTRDRQYGSGELNEQFFYVIDTGGLGEAKTELDHLMEKQAWNAALEADVLLFLVDASTGPVPKDQEVVRNIRKLVKKPVILVVNKIDGVELESTSLEFFSLGLGQPLCIAAKHGRGVKLMLEKALDIGLANMLDPVDAYVPGFDALRLAIVGRPNVGKSTLVNRIMGFERVVVFDAPGTTRDSIYIPFKRQEKEYVIIDNAGMRKKAKIQDPIEKFSVIKTLQSIKECHVALLIIDAREGLNNQDLTILGAILAAGRAIVIVVNKWDGMQNDERENLKKVIDYKLSFAKFAKVYFISALHGSNVGHLFEAVNDAYLSATRILPTTLINDILKKLVEKHEPPMINGRRIKLRYAHSGGHNPQIIVIHGNQINKLPETYIRYLTNGFRLELNLVGTPIRIELRNNENPFAGKKNILSDRQLKKRDRIRGKDKA